MSRLVERDRACVWHPYAAPRARDALFGVVGANGVELELEDGRRVIDGMSSWWSAIHGYGHPALVEALTRQAERMSHVMFGGLTHEPAVALCERLVSLTPEALSRVFLSDSGSVSVEVALKLALQFFQARGLPSKRKLLTVRGGYHGDTLGAMSVCDPVTGMHGLFRGVVPQQWFAAVPGPKFDAPWSPDALLSARGLLEAHADELAAVILEPIVQGTGGMRFYHPQYLRELRRLCDAHDVLLIFDEIATGFGRTGELFALEHAGVVPDILCLGKALTGGMLSLAATLTHERVAEVIGSAEPGVFMHGPTFMANPLACAVSLASVDLLVSGPWRERVQAISAQLEAELAPCRGLSGVADVRVFGAIGVVELTRPVNMTEVSQRLVGQGVWLRPFGKLLYTMPPYIVSKAQLSRITQAMYDVAARAEG